MKPASNLARLFVWPLGVFFRREALGGTALMLSTVVALVWANSPLAATYDALWATQVTFGAPAFGLSKPLILWINDLLMAIFFLLVGLEIKRELVTGELRDFRKALLPVVAAIGGMLVPAGIFLLVAPSLPDSRGWGVPMATDIAFALGCLRLLGKRVPMSLIVFLTALAIIDDLGAILVIALFYTEQISMTALGIAALCAAGLVVMNRRTVMRPSAYVWLGVPLWVALLKSGIHATIAGVVVGLCLPARGRYSQDDVLEEASELVAYAKRPVDREPALDALRRRLVEVESPLERLEHALHPWVAYAIIPIFALANAGVSFAGVRWEQMFAPVSLGVCLGLLVGKPVGVIGATWLAVRSGVAVLPADVTWRHVAGLGALAGIGFTMALFVAGLAYGEGSALHVAAKLGILGASVLSALVGLSVIGGAKPASALTEKAQKSIVAVG